MEILYKVHNNLYVNMTNKCPYSCTFCLRQTMDRIGESGRLWLEREPSAEEVCQEFAKWNLDDFQEVVFCGFGEPTEVWDRIKEVAAFVKKTYNNKPIRINTNGAGNLINGRDIAPEMKGLIDTVSISLNNPDAKKYHELVRSKFGDVTFDAMINFAKECVQEGLKVVLTTVDTTITHEEEVECRKICDEIGAVYRIRPWED
ncbi:MAG: TatD family nuclease-associated radical SAM protein [Eubacteriales bacterium]|nr:TatD family nuclease-associated radical SAM protein [Eubacteriales bacterium]